MRRHTLRIPRIPAPRPACKALRRPPGIRRLTSTLMLLVAAMHMLIILVYM